VARPRIAAGEIGQVQVTRLANGKWRARARMRDDTGELVQLRADGATRMRLAQSYSLARSY
jgi:hypothetical protein